MICKWLDVVWECLVDCWRILGDVLKWVVEIAPTVGDICIFIITVYTFYLTLYPKKLKFLDYSICYSGFWGETIKISLENRSLSSVCVRNVYMKVNDEYIIPIFSGYEDGYRIIDSFHAETFVSKPHTQLYGKDGAKLRIDPATEGKLCVIVETSRGKQTITQKVKRAPFNRKKDTILPRYERQNFNGIVVGKDVAFGLVYYDLERIKHTVLICKSGAMSESIEGIDHVPNNLMKNEKSIGQFFDKMFLELGYTYTLKSIASESSVIKKQHRRSHFRKKIDKRRYKK